MVCRVQMTDIDPIDMADPVLEPEAPHQLPDHRVEPGAEAPARDDRSLHLRRVEVDLRAPQPQSQLMFRV